MPQIGPDDLFFYIWPLQGHPERVVYLYTVQFREPAVSVLAVATAVVTATADAMADEQTAGLARFALGTFDAHGLVASWLCVRSFGAVRAAFQFRGLTAPCLRAARLARFTLNTFQFCFLIAWRWSPCIARFARGTFQFRGLTSVRSRLVPLMSVVWLLLGSGLLLW